MYAPVVVEIVNYFYPIGNTSAVHLTRNLPNEEPADILLLGCGDIRNVLFTLYSDQDCARETDVTCCDIQAATIARNILLLSLVLDDKHSSHDLQLWNIYYHLYLDETSLKLLSDQASRLSELSTSLKNWHDSKYGQQLRFCDSTTMKKVRDVWETYRVPELDSLEHKAWLQNADLAIQRAMKSRKARVGKSGSVFSGMRSAAPVGVQAVAHAPKLEQHFWDTGITSEKSAGLSESGYINPMFVTESSTLHYGTDPLLGFHLATAYCPLSKTSPLQTKSTRTSTLPFKVVEAARVQFKAWREAFRRVSVKNTTLRFFAGDAINFAYALQHANATNLKPANIYHDSYHWNPIVLDGPDYATACDAPLQFNVIDTSNLIDHLGSLNLLVAVIPLLRSGNSSNLYTECMVQQEGSHQDYINATLCGDFPTMSTLLGLFPVEYWANVSPSSALDALPLDLNETTDDSRGPSQKHLKLTWKTTVAGLVSQMPDTGNKLHLDELGLAKVLHTVYLNMFPHENLQLVFSNMSPKSLSKRSMPRYHRGSFALILRFVRNRVTVSWDVMMDYLLRLIESDSALFMASNYIQELYLYLHLYKVLSIPALTSAPMPLGHSEVGRLSDWKDMPSVMCVTLVVPRTRIKVITDVDAGKLGSPIVHCLIQSSPRYRAQNWGYIFSVIQVSFGNLSVTGAPTTNSCQVNIAEDESRWRGSSSLIVSFLVPTSILLLEPQNAKIAFGIQSTPATVQTFMRTLGAELKIFETKLGDESSVFFTRFPPNQNDTSSLLPFPSTRRSASIPENPAASCRFSADIDHAAKKMTTLICRLDILSKDLINALQSGGTVQTSQMSPCTFLETIGTASEPIAFQFPAPVVRMKSRTRIARKSLYIEVVAPLADANSWRDFPGHLYPVILASNAPVVYNISRLNMDRLPTIDISKTAGVDWLNTHAGGMFNARERQLKTEPTENMDARDVRFAFRDSLFSLFMIYTGLQRRKSHIATLCNSAEGGVHAIILISSLKLDLGDRSVALDCAVLPLTDQVMPRLSRFLGALVGLEPCHIQVDGDEMRLWKQNLPAMVERCRTWPHLAQCEYRRQSRIPLSTENGQAVLCSCGSGKMPARFIAGVPHWESVAQYFVRAAIPLCFSTAFSEPLVDWELFKNMLDSKTNEFRASTRFKAHLEEILNGHRQKGG